MSWWSYMPRASVAEQRARTARRSAAGQERPQALAVAIDGRAIARRCWGKAWCDNLEAYRDYEYRLPRGRNYVRSGAALDPGIEAGKITAVVSGTNLYDVEIKIRPVAAEHWTRIQSQCAGHIGSLAARRSPGRVQVTIAPRAQGIFEEAASA